LPDVTDALAGRRRICATARSNTACCSQQPEPDVVFDLESLNFLEVNEAAIRQYRYTREDFVGMSLMDLRAPEKNDQHKKVAVETVEHGVIWRHRRKDGSFLDAEVVWSPMAFRNRFAALAMATDVTERRQVEHRNTISPN